MFAKRDITFLIKSIALGIIIFIASALFTSSSFLKQLYTDYDADEKIVADSTVKTVSVDRSNPTPIDNNPVSSVPKNKTINIWYYSDAQEIMNKYKELNPCFDLEIKYTCLGIADLNLAKVLAAGGADAPDIYCVDSSRVLMYTWGEAAQYAASYKDLGIDVDNLLKEADIAQYTVDIGTRPSDNNIVALGYQGTGGAYIYRRSIAKDVWGTDDPEIIKTKLGPGWDQFFKAAAQLNAKGYKIVSGDGDIWNAVKGGSPTGWIVNGRLNMDPARERFLDYSILLKANGYDNGTPAWTDAWFADMRGAGKKQVFGYFGPAWFINYILDGNSGGEKAEGGTYGDWAVCEPTVNYFWGGTWVLGNKDTSFKETVGSIIEWITLDSSNTGLQYFWANGTLTPDGPGNKKDTVTSGTVMKKLDGKLDFLGGQDMFDIFVPANTLSTSNNMTLFDNSIDAYWLDCVRLYADGKITRSEAIAQFKRSVADNLGIY